jgi:hypothetical protein
MIITACSTTPAQTAPVAICCIKTRRRLPVRTRKSDANRTEAGLKIPAVKMATNLEAVKTPTNIRSTFEAVEDKTAILGKSLLLRKKSSLRFVEFMMGKILIKSLIEIFDQLHSI